MYAINWYVEFTTEGQKTQLGILDELEIVKSVDNLVDIATVSLPKTVMNTPLNLENKIQKGTQVLIKLGYNEVLETEFVGYVQEITANDSSLQIKCEDALFLFRKGLESTELKEVPLKEVAAYVVQQIDPSFSVVCDFEVTYEKYIIHNTTGYELLKKLQEETKASIYFDTEKKKLHIHAPYVQKHQELFYSMQRNIESSSLKYKDPKALVTEVVVESKGKDGKVKTVTVGKKGGDKITLNLGAMSLDSMEKVANAALTRETREKLEGTFTAWLIPNVAPGDSIRIKDEEYSERDARYYTVAVTTKISEQGAVRTVTPGIKLS